MRFTLILCLTLVGCSKTRNPAMTQTASPVSAMLSVGIDSAQMFTATFNDPNGGSQIAEVTLSIMSDNIRPGGRSRWSANQCLLRYDIAENAIWLVPDVGGTWGSHSITAGSSSTFSNSQCTVLASGSSAQVSGKTVTVDLQVKFTDKFAGTKQLYVTCEDTKGNWSPDYQRQFSSFIVAAVPTP